MIGSAAIAARQKTALAARVQARPEVSGSVPNRIDVKPPEPVVTARSSELRSLLDQIRPWYPDVIDNLAQAVAAAEARLAPVREAGKMISIADAQDRWGLSKAKVFKLMRSGRVETAMIRGQRLIDIRSMRGALGLLRT